MVAFVETCVDFVSTRFADVIKYRNIQPEHLRLAVKQSYEWTEHAGRPSQLLTLRLVCARVCFGSYFMEDIRYSELQRIVKSQVDAVRLTDADPIYNFIVDHIDDWSVDWFAKNLEIIWSLAAARQVIPRESPDWPTGEQIFDKLFDVEKRTAFRLTDTLRTDVFHMLKETVSPISSFHAGEQIQLLLAIGQYYDGLRCFDDPLRPRWYGVLNPDDMELTRWQIQKVYTPEQGN
jgi:hypothetical protein